MKLSKEKSAENRARILAEAGRLFRERGVSGTGVDALAEAAGLTHGSLYSQFGSKEQLAIEALTEVFAQGGAKHAEKGLEVFLDHYLSPRHRDAIGSGCGVAALCSEMPRQAPALRARFTEGVRSLAARIGAKLAAHRGVATEEEALAALSSVVGALVLARAVNDGALSARILAAAKARLLEG
jgi:TetR/AcrR family transcriptional repressor of nem operon